MKNRFKYPLVLMGIFVLFSLTNGFTQKDTVTLLIRGEFKRRDEFLIRYKKEALGEFGYEKDYASFQIIIDSSQTEFANLDLRIYRRKWFGNEQIYQLFLYDPRSKYLHIYHPKSNRKSFFEIFYLDTSESLYPFHCVVK